MGADQSAPRRYRSGKRVREERDTDHLERALELLEENDFSNLAHARFPKVKGALSWAKLGEYACDAIKRELVQARDGEDIHEAIEHARILESRLRARDGIKGARTTRDLREAIMNLAALTKALGEMAAIRSGTLAPNHDNGARATVIRQKWVRLGLGDSPFAKRLMEETVATVLASTSASGGVKALFNRAMATWLPSPAPTEGTKVEWDSDLDD
jgi:hypothetical protein